MRALKNSNGEWDWLKITVPVLTVIIIPLIALVYNNIASAIDRKSDKAITELCINDLKIKVKNKVDNETLILMLEQQKQQQEFLKEQLKEQKTIDKETLKTLQNLNIQMKIIEQRIK
jgi:hypothetical protein